MAGYDDLKKLLREALNLLESPDPQKDENIIRKKLEGLLASLKDRIRAKDPKIVTACLGPHAVLAARFYNNQGALEIHDHRGHLMTLHGDLRLQIGGYAMDVNQSVRDELSRSGLLGEELIKRNILKRWVD